MDSIQHSISAETERIAPIVKSETAEWLRGQTTRRVDGKFLTQGEVLDALVAEKIAAESGKESA